MDDELPWINKELLHLILCKKKVYREWKYEQITREDYKEVVQTARDQVRKGKTQRELYLFRDVKGNKKKFCWCISDKK